MKKTINGKTYDTGTAKAIAHWNDVYLSSDPRYSCETLYIQKDGSLFLCGSGGPESNFAGTQKITPVTTSEAVKFIKRRAYYDEEENALAELGMKVEPQYYEYEVLDGYLVRCYVVGEKEKDMMMKELAENSYVISIRHISRKHAEELIDNGKKFTHYNQRKNRRF